MHYTICCPSYYELKDYERLEKCYLPYSGQSPQLTKDVNIQNS